MSKRVHSFLTHPQLTRRQILVQSLITAIVFVIFSYRGHPFHPYFNYIVLSSSIIHLVFYLIFTKVYPAYPLAFVLLSILDVILLGFAVHFSGGILSPFVFVFFSIILMEASYGIEYPKSSGVALIVYLFVVIGEFTGIFKPFPITTHDIYADKLTAAIVVIVSIVYMAGSGQVYKHIMKFLRDKIEQEHWQKQNMIKALAKLEAPSQIGLLVNKIVHDIRGPLGAVSGFIQLFPIENTLSDNSAEDCKIMLSELNRVSHLLNRLLKYTKPGDSEKEMICPVDLLETVISVLSFLPGARQVNFETVSPKGGARKFFANKEELQQVYFNLLKNSVEAFENKEGDRRIRVDVEDSETQMIIKVTDNGPGIPKSVLEKLSSEIVTTKKDGTGVGLIIAREILGCYGGSLSVQREINGGTCIVTQIPFRRDVATPPNKKAVEKFA